ADQPLREAHQRALAQIVRAGLERQADHADLAGARVHHHLRGVVDVQLVRLHDGAQHRQLHVAGSREVENRAQVLRQARAAEREAGAQIGGRDVEARVLANEPHDVPRIDAEALAQTPDLVRERNLERMEDVAGELQHLRDPVSGLEERRGELAEQLPDLLGGARRGAADYRERRIVKIVDGRALAKELRLEAHAEVDARTLPGVLLQNGAYDVLRGAGVDRRAQNDDRIARRRAQRDAELLGDPPHRRQVLLAVPERGSTDAYEDQIALGRRAVDRARDLQSAAVGRLPRNLADLVLDHGREALREELELDRIAIDSQHLVSVAREAGGRHRSDVA